jgi:hypothetical protein
MMYDFKQADTRPRMCRKIRGNSWSEVLQVIGFICFWVIILIGSA